MNKSKSTRTGAPQKAASPALNPKRDAAMKNRRQSAAEGEAAARLITSMTGRRPTRRRASRRRQTAMRRSPAAARELRTLRGRECPRAVSYATDPSGVVQPNGASDGAPHHTATNHPQREEVPKDHAPQPRRARLALRVNLRNTGRERPVRSRRSAAVLILGPPLHFCLPSRRGPAREGPTALGGEEHKLA
jgi:hypothetical protein